MIAVVDKANRVVWGLGLNEAEAMADALAEIAGKPKFKVNRSALEYAPMKENAPLHLDGETLFDYCLAEEPKTTTQLGLF